MPLLTLGVLGSYLSARTLESEATNHAWQLIRQVTRNIESSVRQTESIIAVVDSDPDLQAFMAFEGSTQPFSARAEAAARQLLRSISDAHPEIAGILVVSADNHPLSNEIQPITRDPLTEESWYKEAVDNPGTVRLLSRPIGRNLRSSHEYSADDVVSIVKAVVDPRGSRIRGVVLIDLRLAVMEGILADLTVGLRGFLFIQASGGAVVYTPVNPIVYRMRDEWLGAPRAISVRRIKGADYQIVSQWSDYTQWKTVGVFPLNEIMSQVSNIRTSSLIIAGVTVLAALLVSFLFTSGIARPVIELRSLMKEAQEGNLSVRFEGRQEDEIGYLGKSFNAMIGEVQKLLDLVYREQQSIREAELKVLQEQIKPHFLYNTLDTIQWMAQEHGAQDIVKVVGALTTLFRIGLSRGKEMISLSDELEHVRSYLIIQKARYEDKFDFELRTDDEVMPFMVLKLTLQPLVENAIYHGIKERRVHGSILVEARRQDGMLVMRVSDNGVGMGPAKLQEIRALLAAPAPRGEGLAGYGIHNVHERIQLSFGSRYGLRFESTQDQGTTVEVLHPLVAAGGGELMWKVMIADDEPKIRRGLKAAIEHLRPDMKVVAEAEDGETALALVRSVRPDILMIDVRMPFLNGLELIERISGEAGDCIVIVVSGHDEFQYAQRALQLKVFEYLLKPVPQDLLAGVLARAEEALAAARRQQQYLAWARDQLQRNLPLLRELFLRDWVRGRLSPVEVTEQAQFLGVQASGPVAMAMIHIVDRAVATAPSDERERRLALFAIRSVVEEAFAELAPLTVFSDDRDDIVVLCGAADAKTWAEAPAKIERRVVPSLCQALIVVQASAQEALQGVPEAYEALSAEVARRGSHGALVVLAQHYIDAHYHEPTLSLEEVASSARISPGYLSRLLKLETGYSFVEYLTRVRINKALQLMHDPAAKVYEVAEAVGYQSQHYFSRAFKRVFGRPPVEYRKAGA